MKKYLLLVLLAALSPAFATTVQNLDSVPSAIQHPEGKQIFAEQMAEQPQPKDLASFHRDYLRTRGLPGLRRMKILTT